MYMHEEAHLFGSFFNFVENNAVGLIYLYLSSVHDKQSVLQIHRKYLYIVHELKNYIDVYTYEEVDGNPEFEKIQTVSTLNDYHAGGSAASALNISAPCDKSPP